MMSWIQAIEMGFLRRVAGLRDKDNVRNLAFVGEPGVELFLL